MSHPNPNPDSEGNFHRGPMWTVSELQDLKERLLGMPDVTGSPRGAVSAVLDADIQRSRLFKAASYTNPYGSGGQRYGVRRISSVVGTELFRKLVHFREAFREPDADPALWFLRIRWSYRALSYPLSYIQCAIAQEPSGSGTLQARPTKDTASYRALAAWACGCMRIQPVVGPLCGEIHHGLQLGSAYGEFRFPLPETQAWIQWAGEVRPNSFSVPKEKMGTFQYHRDRWKELGLTPKHAGRLLEAYEGQWDACGDTIREAQEQTRERFRTGEITVREARNEFKERVRKREVVRIRKTEEGTD